MEVLIKQDVVLPVRILLEFLRASIHWTISLSVAEKHACIAASNLLRDFKQSHVIAGASRAFHLEVRTLERIQLQQPADDQPVHRHPYRTTPVGVPTEHA